jgi:hypothetical protein
MHIVVSWDINEPASNNWNEWNERLKAVLQPFAWVRPLRTVYVVPIPDAVTHATIVSNLSAVANSAPGGSVHVLVSPSMVGGQYGGVLPANLWPELNRRTA